MQASLEVVKSQALAAFITLNAWTRRGGLGVPLVLTDMVTFYMLQFSLDKENLIEYVKLDTRDQIRSSYVPNTYIFNVGFEQVFSCSWE